MSGWIRAGWNLLFVLPFQVGALTIAQVVGFMIAAQIAGLATDSNRESNIPRQAETISVSEDMDHDRNASADDSTTRREKQLRMLGMLVLACLSNAVALVFWLRNTSLSGIHLGLVSFAVFFLCMTIMPQTDTYFFVRNPWRIIRSAATLGLVVSAMAAVTSVVVLGRWRRLPQAKNRIGYSVPGIAVRLSLSVLAYVALYVVFGYFIAWQNPELRALYGGGDSVLGFFERITTPPVPNRVIPFQAARGLAWALLCGFMLRVSLGGQVRSALAIALFIAVVMNSQLLLPNPLMSERVRLVHLLETATSNFLFGLICTWLWTIRLSNPSS